VLSDVLLMNCLSDGDNAIPLAREVLKIYKSSCQL
jgi:hypothetical protein